MPLISYIKIDYFLLITVIFVLRTDSGALSIFEQKKYKTLTDGQGLYSSKDDVEILTATNFKEEIYNNKRAWLVEFYNSWCGFCQRFAPSWKALATDVKSWKDLVGIGAIDCSNDQNYPICREFEIMGYPTVRYFHEKYQEGPKNFGLKLQPGSDLKEHKEKLLSVIINEEKEGRGTIFPNLVPYNYHDLSSVFKSLPKEVKYVFLFIQESTEFIAQEITMDFHKMKDFVIRYAFQNNTELLKLLGVSKTPILLSIDRDYNHQTISVDSSTREAYRIAISQFLKPKHIDVAPQNENKNIFRGKWKDYNIPDMASFMHQREREALKERLKKMGDVVFQMDLETALRYSLKHEVAGIKEISGDKLIALRSYLDALAKYFPFGKYGKLFLTELRDFAKNRITVFGDDIADMVENAEKDERQVFSSKPDWLACKGSSSNYRGYPCGLWKLFHYLTVNAADQNNWNKQSDYKAVLLAMHGYIKNFFGCEDCSRHFQEMAKRRDLDQVSSWDDSILWLWSAHNEVNKRLSGDQTEDPEYPKIQFPSKENCPRCYNFNHSWHFPEVLYYLKHTYNSINVRYIGSDTRILHLGLDGSFMIDQEYNESNIFQKIDKSLCFILYLASFLLIVGLIRMFLKRGYKKKTYHHSLLGKV